MITISVKELLIGLVLVALLVLIIFLIVLAAHAIGAVKNLTKITADASTVTAITKDRAEDINGIVGDLSESLGAVSGALKGEQNLIGTVVNVGKATASAVSYFKKSGESK